MATAFERTLRTLEASRFWRLGLSLAAAAGILSLWMLWSLRADLVLYEVSEHARLEIERASYPIQSPMRGRVVSTHLVLGQEIAAGDVLVELDAGPEQLQLRQEEVRLAAIVQEIHAIETQIAAEEQARVEEQRTTRLAIAEAQARRGEAEAPATFAATDLERLNLLRAKGLIAERDYSRGVAEAQKTRATAEGARLIAQRLEQEQKTRDSERAVRLERLRADTIRLNGQRRTGAVSVEKLRYEVEQRRIRAAVAGRLGEVAPLRVGTMLQEGEHMGAILTQGRLLVVAYFPPATVGRLHPGQYATIRLQGFPWAEFGTVKAQVERVADEVRDDKVRVEMAVLDMKDLRVPLRHGMPGTVEVAVEHSTPAVLLLRLAGQVVATVHRTDTLVGPRP
jgi:membrane fusion protein (multidrug efflux system)